MCLRCASSIDQANKQDIQKVNNDCALGHALLIAPNNQEPTDPFARIAADLANPDQREESIANYPAEGEADPLGAPGNLAPRRKLWELDGGIHCAVIGTCLTLRELRQMLRKVSIKISPDASDYDIHRAFVGVSRHSGKAARLINKQLDQKYRHLIREIGRMEHPGELERCWEQALRSGEVDGAFWALLTDLRTTPELIERIYGDIHMLSHLSGASVRIDLQELKRTKRRLEDLEVAKSESERSFRRQLKQREIDTMALEERIRELEAELVQRTERLDQLSRQFDSGGIEQLNALNQDLLSQLTGVLQRLATSQQECDKWKRLAARSTDRSLKLEGQLAEARSEREALEKVLQPLLDHAPETDTGECLGAACEHQDLCGRCILYVGGRAKQYAHFRDLVERSNGQFIHHDGGREDNPKRLGSILSKADAVLCPLDCVSHDAVNRLKRLCETNAKRLVLIPRSSLASFARGLREVE